MREIGLYIHIPFCKSKCNYCDFYSLSCPQSDKIADYVSVICAHMRREAELYEDCVIDSIFLGGGTPSLVEPKDITRLFATVRECFSVSGNVEITLEVNPESVTIDKLVAYRACGVNRISIGMQSALDSELKCLGRVHSHKRFKSAFGLIREAGFDNVSVDIMYALPSQTLEALTETIDFVLDISPEHISCYALKVEDGTPFSKMELSLPDESTQYDMYMMLCERLGNAGYEHYEISNFAKNSHRCAHNLKYWHSQEYISYGPASHSFFDGARYYYEDDLRAYCDAVNAGKTPKRLLEDSTALTDEEKMDEYVMLALRLSDGISLDDFKARFGVDFEGLYDILEFLGTRHLLKENGTVRFSEKGFLVSNFILSKILKTL